ncbi:MAG: glutaminase A [Acidobacteria bacterium]|nr:glutaminase A [Acidobacteriota bacterium]
MQEILDRIVAKARGHARRGRPASYIPALSRARRDLLGVSVFTLDGRTYHAGDHDRPFTMQSISKVFCLACVLKLRGDRAVFALVDREPSGDPFYSLVLLEYENGRPRNPMINAGAILITSLLPGRTSAAKFAHYMRFLEGVLPGKKLDIDPRVYASEFETGQRNRALGCLMKHFGVLQSATEDAVDAYFRQCSVRVTCDDLARMGLFLAGRGVDPITGRRVIAEGHCKTINALMATCGLYDASGDFAHRVGLPGKSGVGGGILAIAPGKMSVAVYGPALDPKGSSVAGFEALEMLSQELELSLYL